MRVSIRLRLFSIIALSALSISVVAASIIFISRTSEIELHLQQLNAVRDVKSDQIEEYFSYMLVQANTMAENLMVIDALKEFSEAFASVEISAEADPDALRSSVIEYLEQNMLPRIPQNQRPLGADRLVPENPSSVELMHRYLANNPNSYDNRSDLFDPQIDSYDQTHALYHPVFDSYARQNGLKDILLIETSSGNVLYSAAKFPEFATNVIDGPYSRSSLSRAFQAGASSEAGQPVMLDFSPYLPAHMDPAGFIVAPVVDGGEHIGVIVFHLAMEPVARIASWNRDWEASGMGSTGETFILGVDRMLRSESRSFLEDPENFTSLLQQLNRQSLASEIEDFGTTILHLAARSPAIDSAFRGNRDSMISENYLGNQVLSAFTPLAIEGVNWVLMAEIGYSEVLSYVNGMIYLSTVYSIVLMLVLIVVVLLISRSITRPLVKTVNVLKDISGGEGDLTVRIQDSSTRETAMLARYFNDFVMRLNDIISSIKERVVQAETLSDTLLASSEESSAAVHQISRNLESIGAQIKGLDDSVRTSFTGVEEIRESTGTLLRSVSTQRDAVQLSASASQQMVASIQSVHENLTSRQERSTLLSKLTEEGGDKLEHTLQQISQIQQAADKIMEAVTIIQGISDQTNLLAMNAAIEAAHAGDAGRGFSVVADEIRKLSETSRENSIIITDNVKESVALINNAMTVANETGQSFTEIQSEVDEFTRLFADISQSMDEVAAGSSNILDNMETLSGISTQVSEESERLSHGAEDIHRSITLVKQVSDNVVESISEIDIGIEEISHGSQALAKLGQENREHLQSIGSQIGDFTTEQPELAEVVHDEDSE